MTWKRGTSILHPRIPKSLKKSNRKVKSLRSRSMENTRRVPPTNWMKPTIEDKKSSWTASLDSKYSASSRRHHQWAKTKKSKSRGIPKCRSFPEATNETTKANKDRPVKKLQADTKWAAATALKEWVTNSRISHHCCTIRTERLRHQEHR